MSESVNNDRDHQSLLPFAIAELNSKCFLSGVDDPHSVLPFAITGPNSKCFFFSSVDDPHSVRITISTSEHKVAPLSLSAASLSPSEEQMSLPEASFYTPSLSPSEEQSSEASICSPFHPAQCF